MPELLEYFLTSLLDAAWFIQMIVVSFSWVILCKGIVWPKGKRLRIAAQFVLLLLSMMVVDIFVLFVPNAPFTMLWNVAHGVIGAIYLCLCADYRRTAKTVLWCTMFAGTWCLTAIAGQSSYLVGTFIGKGLVEAVVRLSIDVLMIPLAFFLRAFRFDDYESVPKSGLRLVFAGDISLILLSVAEVPFIGSGYAVTTALLTANTCMLVVMMLMVHAIWSMCKSQAEVLALQAESQRLQSEQELVRLTESNLEDLRCVRHDLKNQYAYMRLLLQQKQYDELETYFNKLADSVDSPVPYIDCGNRIIDNVLNMELSKAKHAGIPVEHQLIVPPELPFADDDVCAILANLMDNAIEECKRLREKRDAQVSIRITMHPHGSYLYIVCRNTSDRKKLNRIRNALQTTKGDTQIHGYGTRIVAKLAEKYNGSVEFGLKDGQFVAKVILDIMEGAHEN